MVVRRLRQEARWHEVRIGWKEQGEEQRPWLSVQKRQLYSYQGAMCSRSVVKKRGWPNESRIPPAIPFCNVAVIRYMLIFTYVTRQ
jgi:hypothetical protein